MIKILEYKNLTYSYNKNKCILNNLNLKVPSDTIHGILGHNGAGKTTLFKLTTNILKENSGKILLNNSPELRKFIGYMPENNGIYEKLTATQNLFFRANIFGHKNFSKEYMEELLDEFKLLQRKDEAIFYWSSGMKKRLAFACSLISTPKLLILDEPTNGIDPESLEILENMLLKLKQKGITILISTHNLDFIKRIGDNISIIQNGEVIYSNDINSIKHSLKDLYIKYTVSEEE